MAKQSLVDRSFQLSLLWKNNKEQYFEIEDADFLDINLESFMEIVLDNKREDLRQVIQKMPTQTDTILYRQQIFKDLLDHPELLENFKVARKRSDYMTGLVKFAYEREYTIYNLLKRVEEAEDVMHIVEYLYGSVKNHQVKSEGLTKLRDLLNDVITSRVYEQFKKDLEHVRTMDGSVRSIKVGMNFDENLKPKEAIVLALDSEKVAYKRYAKKVDKTLEKGVNYILSIPRMFFAPETLIPKSDLNELEVLLEPAIGQLIKFCDTFDETVLTLVDQVLKDLSFYEGMMAFHQKMVHHNISLSRPVIGDETSLSHISNINLLCKMLNKPDFEMVYNNFAMSSEERLFVLTGANRGGKTTLTQAIGQVFLLSQLGFMVPGRNISIKPITAIYTIFPREEKVTVDYGRLGEECHRFSDIYDVIDESSLLLLNETFSGTSHLESLVLAKESMKALSNVGCRVIFNTHLHELYPELVEEGEGHYISIVSGTKELPGSFIVKRSEPLGKSYAKEIAEKYGVSYGQLLS